MDKVAVVILNWNGLDMLKRFLPGVLAHTCGTVYVVDNASTDLSLSWLAEAHPEVKTVVLEKNYGFAEGYNKGLAHIEAEYYVLLNSDVEIKGDWLSPMLRYMEVHAETVACQPKVLSQCEDTRFEYAGAAGGFIDALGYPFCRGRIFNTIEEDRGQYDRIEPIFWATGAALMVRSKIYKEVGGLDGRFFAHMEEIDFCWRLRSRGYGIVCVPESVVYHVGGGTLPQSSPRKTFLNFRNNLYMLYKNLPDDRLKYVMTVRYWLDMLAALQFLMKGEWGSCKAVFKAHRMFLKQKKAFYASRRENLRHAFLNTIPEQATYSILWEYYVKRRRVYSSLKK